MLNGNHGTSLNYVSLISNFHNGKIVLRTFSYYYDFFSVISRLSSDKPLQLVEMTREVLGPDAENLETPRRRERMLCMCVKCGLTACRVSSVL